MGTGNIAGVATAISIGGPGAVFWMWLVAFLGASTAYVESTLGQIYKEKDDKGQYRGGPAFYIEKAMGQKWYAMIFAVVTIIATGFLLPGVQANSIAAGFDNAWGIPTMVSGGVHRHRAGPDYLWWRQAHCAVRGDRGAVHGAGVHHHGGGHYGGELSAGARW